MCFGGAGLAGQRPREEGGGRRAAGGGVACGTPGGGVAVRGRGRAGRADSQHEVLLPARLVAAHRDGRALDILHLQGHVRVEFLCGGESRVSAGFREDAPLPLWVTRADPQGHRAWPALPAPGPSRDKPGWGRGAH